MKTSYNWLKECVHKKPVAQNVYLNIAVVSQWGHSLAPSNTETRVDYFFLIFRIIAIASNILIVYGIIKYIKVRHKNNKEDANKAKKMIVYGLFLMVLTGIIYAWNYGMSCCL